MSMEPDSGESESAFQTIKSQLASGTNVSEAIHDLGTLLRDAENRSSLSAKSLIPQVATLFPEARLSVLRALINFSADNVENRKYLLSEEPRLVDFWASAVDAKDVKVDLEDDSKSEQEQKYLMILINQFIYSVGDKNMLEFLEKFAQIGVVDWVCAYHGKLGATAEGREEISGPADFLVEYSRLFPELVTPSEFENVVDVLFQSSDQNRHAPDLDSCLAHAQILFNSTNVEDSARKLPLERVKQVLAKLPENDEQSRTIARKLFATCGNIYSWPSFDNWQEIEASLADIDTGHGPLVAAAAVSLGNCVASKEDQAKLVERINATQPIEDVALRVFSTTFSDVVYFQACHFFNNTLTAAVSAQLLVASNADIFYRNTKVVVDNFAYYKEVGHVYMKYLRRLVASGCLEGEADAMVFESGWQYLLENIDSTQLGELVSLLSQAIARHPGPYSGTQKLLMGSVLKLGTSIDIQALLQKITAVSVFLKNYTSHDILEMYGPQEFEPAFVSQLQAFLEQLEDALSQAESQTESKIGSQTEQKHAQNTLRNNSRFLALLVQQSLHPIQASHGASMQSVCDTAARIVAGMQG